MLLVFQIIVFELVAVSSPYYYEFSQRVNLVLFIINFQPRYYCKGLIEKCMGRLMKSINTLITNLIKRDLARVKKSC